MRDHAHVSDVSQSAGRLLGWRLFFSQLFAQLCVYRSNVGADPFYDGGADMAGFSLDCGCGRSWSRSFIASRGKHTAVPEGGVLSGAGSVCVRFHGASVAQDQDQVVARIDMFFSSFVLGLKSEWRSAIRALFQKQK